MEKSFQIISAIDLCRLLKCILLIVWNDNSEDQA